MVKVDPAGLEVGGGTGEFTTFLLRGGISACPAGGDESPHWLLVLAIDMPPHRSDQCSVNDPIPSRGL